MGAGMHSIWISEHLQELDHEVIVANVRELRAISHSDRKSDQVDAEKLARYALLDPKILRPISHRTVAQQETLTLIRARNVIVRLRTAAVNAVRGLAKPCGYPQLGITKAGNVYLRSLLVECANHVLGPRGKTRPCASGGYILHRAEASSHEIEPSSPSLASSLSCSIASGSPRSLTSRSMQ
jgi:transposase